MFSCLHICWQHITCQKHNSFSQNKSGFSFFFISTFILQSPNGWLIYYMYNVLTLFYDHWRKAHSLDKYKNCACKCKKYTTPIQQINCRYHFSPFFNICAFSWLRTEISGNLYVTEAKICIDSPRLHKENEWIQLKASDLLHFLLIYMHESKV